MKPTVAILLSCDSFESFFGDVIGVDKTRYLTEYRSDWSWYYAKGMLDNGLRPILYLPSLHESGYHETQAGVAVRFLPLAAWYKPLARFRRACRATRWSLYAQERVNAMALMKPLRAAIAEDRTRVLYVQEYWCGRFDHLVGRVGVPVSAQDHGGLPQKTVKWFRRRAFRDASTCYGQTEVECRLIERYGAKAQLQPNGCDVTEFCPDPEVVPEKTILTVGRLTDKQKRTSDLIRTMARLPEDWSLDILGNGPDRDMLERLARECDVAHRVRFRGFVGRSEVRNYVRRCGVYAMPSANEGLCLALLEAMGCGASVVVTRIRAFEPVVRDRENGRMVPVGDPVALAAAIEDAWLHRARYGDAALRTITERFNATTLYRRLADSLRATANLPAVQTHPAGLELAEAV